MHDTFSNTLNQCFETKRPSRSQQGIMLLTLEQEEFEKKMKKIDPITLTNLRKPYLPELALNLKSKLKKKIAKEEEEKLEKFYQERRQYKLMQKKMHECDNRIINRSSNLSVKNLYEITINKDLGEEIQREFLKNAMQRKTMPVQIDKNGLLNKPREESFEI